jgi:hypothetical protein
MAAANVNMRFAKTNDLISTDCRVDPALGFEFGYTDLVFVRAGVGNSKTLSNWTTPKSGFQPNMGWVSYKASRWIMPN